MEKKYCHLGEIFTQEIFLTDKINKGTINIGNQNSYGDCFSPWARMYSKVKNWTMK